MYTGDVVVYKFCCPVLLAITFRILCIFISIVLITFSIHYTRYIVQSSAP